ncbi:MAG: gluconolactonase [Defluviitaleaceae bacterium]|nr:gluconolactonase [Defluviitaleaceae bacterium]
MKKKLLVLLILVFVLSPLPSVIAVAGAPFESYRFDFYGYEIAIPNPYHAVKSVSGRDLGIADFVNPTDFFVRDDMVYLLDAGASQIVIFDEYLNLINVIGDLNYNGVSDSFNSPQGIFVGHDHVIYVADTENRRVVVLDDSGNIIRTISNPESDSIPEDFIFLPEKLVADTAGRVFVVARNMFEGIMSFDREGEFFGFFGTVEVTFSPIDLFWRTVATQAQRARLGLFLPTEFSNIAIDPEGFIYATIIDTAGDRDFIMRINAMGRNVLTNYSPLAIQGDFNFRLFGDFSGASTFVDIIYRGYGIYSALDFTRNRIFTYDGEGNLLYVFGGPGNAMGMLRSPVAIEYLGDNILVLDAARREVVFFAPTEYGRFINTATAMRFIGDEEQSVYYWRRVLALDAHYELALSGIGRSLLAANEYREAMVYLRRALDYRNYSIAFSRHRNQVLRDNLPIVFTVAVVGAVVWVSFKIYKRVKPMFVKTSLAGGE